ncbi:MAG TPA: APC family permease, partial [Burkholderiaceae bacterium]
MSEQTPSGGSTAARESMGGQRRPLPGSPGYIGPPGAGTGGGGEGGGEGGEAGGLQRVLGVPALFAAAYGNVGSSIYYALGLVAGFALGLTPVAFVVSGVIFVFTAMTYAEATTRYPEAGGASSFARHAFNEFTSFVTAWAQMLNYIITMAISAYFVPHYLKFFWGALKHDRGSSIGGIIVIILLALLNIVGVEETAALTVGLAVADFGTQVLLALLGMFLLLSPHVLVANVHLGMAPTWKDFLLGITVSMIAYTGIETISNLAEETRDPVRSVPRAIGWVVAAVLGLYIILPVVAMSALPVRFPGPGQHFKPYTELGTRYADDPFVGMVRQFTLPAHWLETALLGYVAILASVILFIATNAAVLGVSRVTYSMAQHRQVPNALRSVHPKFLTPWIAIT